MLFGIDRQRAGLNAEAPIKQNVPTGLAAPPMASSPPPGAG